MSKAAAQVGTYNVRDVAQAVGVPVRRVRFYVEKKLVPPPLSRGAGRVYTEQHVLGLRAIRALREQGLHLEDIRGRLRRATNEELVAMGKPGDERPREPEKTDGAHDGTATTPRYPAQSWERIELLPGLELHLRSDGGALLARLAEEIHARYAVKA